MQNFFKQHMPSNDRTFTDEYLVESSSQFSYGRNKEELEANKSKYEFITISDKQIAEMRQATKNTFTVGDCVNVILAQEFRDYTGMIDAAREELEKSDDEENAPKVKDIISALYCFDTQTTYYFLG